MRIRDIKRTVGDEYFDLAAPAVNVKMITKYAALNRNGFLATSTESPDAMFDSWEDANDYIVHYLGGALCLDVSEYTIQKGSYIPAKFITVCSEDGDLTPD